MHHLKFALGAVFLGLSFSSHAALVTYILGDHPDGSLYIAPNISGPNGPYGIRIDDIDPPNGDGPTFSVGSNLGGSGGLVTLTWDPMDLSVDALINGSVYRNDLGSTWQVSYRLSGLAAAGNGGFTAQTGTGEIFNNGTLFSLTGESDGNAVFEFDNDGHRLQGDPGVGWVGRGWLLPEGSVDDWLVTGTIIPLPASVWLFGASLMSLLGLRRKLS